MVSEHGPEINTRTPCWNRFHRPSLRGTDPKEKLRHFVDVLKPAFRHDVRLVEPKDYRGAVDKALRADQDWKAFVEERQLKRQAFQQKDQRPPKKPYKNQQRSQEQKPQEHKLLVVQPISVVSVSWKQASVPKCQKNHPASGFLSSADFHYPTTGCSLTNDWLIYCYFVDPINCVDHRYVPID
ncbi:hypothetical protein F511_39378 [Dorcoceras hygrometricum]|uniref:Uncharacterized protein n=1 Tax=Dorcoceras hygrometricum TaxID=472368 RepID=A0A2Z7AMH4_9LAMI|nr:hypothetical protein F511_39378 [Dorcoceras hygrometricum]